MISLSPDLIYDSFDQKEAVIGALTLATTICGQTFQVTD